MRIPRRNLGSKTRPGLLVLGLTALGFSSLSLGFGEVPLQDRQAARPVVPASRVEATVGLQWDETRGCPASHPLYGGIGRDGGSTPDLANTVLAIQALRAAGVPRESPRIQRALIFIARCQDRSDPAGTTVGRALERGGFAQCPADSRSGDGPESRRPGGLSTCLGITGLLAAGVAPDDARVSTAFDWLQTNYTLDANPGMLRPGEGLYGYYYELAKALTALGQDRLRDGRGVVHDWRRELERKLAAQQNADGSWRNPDESPEPCQSQPTIITSYALLTLCQIRK